MSHRHQIEIRIEYQCSGEPMDPNMVTSPESARHFRALFISDVHLGTRGCQADRLLDFLRHHDADTIYLVGDIVDGWQLRSSWYWPQAHNDVVQKLLRQARKGVRIVYVPGNHDEFLRDYCISAASRSSSTPSTRQETDGGISSFTAIISISWSRRRPGSRISAAGPTTSPSPSIACSMRCAGGSAFPTGRCRNGRS